MKIYILGNEDMEMDKRAIEVAEKFKNFNKINFIFIKPNEDLAPEKYLILMDTVVGLEEVTLLTEKDLEKLEFPKRATVHDYDLGFQLRYLIKLGKIKNVKIIGLPAGSAKQTAVDYERVRSILRKLVAQDIQGS